MAVLAKLYVRTFGASPRPADVQFVPSQLIQWQLRLIEPMGGVLQAAD